MSPVTLEKAIRAFCREAGIDRRSVHTMRVAGHVAFWVKEVPQEPVFVDGPRYPTPRLDAYASQEAHA